MATINLYETVISGTTGDNDVALNSEIDFIDDDETDSATFTVLRDYSCSVGDQLDYYDYTNTKIYSGVIRDITNDNPKELLVFKFDILLSDRIVNDIFESYTLEDLIEHIVTTYSSLTFSTSFVSGITIDRYVAKNKNALEVVKDLISQVPNLTYNVDNSKVFTLFIQQSIDSSISLTNGTNCRISGGWSEDTSNQVTRLTLIGEKQVQESKVELFSGTGAQTEYTLTEIPSGIKIEVDSGSGFIEQDLDVDGQRTGDYTVVRETKKVTFLTGSIPPSGTDNIRITYTFEIDITLEYDAPIDIQNTYGIIEKKVTKKYITNMDDAFDFCTQYISTYSEPLLNAAIQRLNSINITNLVPGYKIFVTDNINEVNGSNIAQFFTIKRVKRLFPEGTLLIEVGETGVNGVDIIKEAKYNIRQLYEQDNNSSIIQKSQIINNPLYIDTEQEIELQLYRDLPDDYLYLGDENDSPVYANIGGGTERPLKDATEIPAATEYFITSGLEWNNNPDNEIPGLTRWYKLDGDVTDSSVNGVDASVLIATSGSEDYDTGLQFTEAFNFVGTGTPKKVEGAYISLPSNYDADSQNHSLSFWYKSSSSYFQMLFIQSLNSSSSTIEFRPSDNEILVESTTNNNWDKGFPTGIDIDDGEWHHYVFVFSSSDTKLYVDGSLADTETANTDPLGYFRYRIIGGYGATTFTYGEMPTGVMADVRLYDDKQLDSSEVLDLYNSGNGLTFQYSSWRPIR